MESTPQGRVLKLANGVPIHIFKFGGDNEDCCFGESCGVCHLAGRTAHWWTEQGNRQSWLVETYVPEEGFGECGTGIVRLTTP